jgi:hypothetical protein
VLREIKVISELDHSAGGPHFFSAKQLSRYNKSEEPLHQISEAIESLRRVGLGDVDVECDGGQILLTGTVTNLCRKQLAQDRVRRSIHESAKIVNRIRVDSENLTTITQPVSQLTVFGQFPLLRSFRLSLDQFEHSVDECFVRYF